MSSITTHALDTVLGLPAAQIVIRLERHGLQGWLVIAHGVTDANGRCINLPSVAQAGLYRLTFEVSSYFERHGRTSLYPEIVITFRCNGKAHYHLPLLLADNSYTTYRGS